MFHAYGWTDRQTDRWADRLTGRLADKQTDRQEGRQADMTKLTVTLRNLVNVPKNVKPI